MSSDENQPGNPPPPATPEQPPAPPVPPTPPAAPVPPPTPPAGAPQEPFAQQPPAAQQPYPPQQPPAPQQPYGQQPYPQQAPYAAPPTGYAGQQPAPDYPGHAPQGAQPPAERKGLSKGALIGIIGGGAALVAIIVVVAVALTSLLSGGGQPAANPGGGEGEPVATTPDAVVTGYLEALAASDAEQALSYVESPPADLTFLTDEVLQASNARAPITGISVTAPTNAEFSVEVQATYSIGDEQVSTTFNVSDYDDDGTWSMSAGTSDIQLGSRVEGLEVTLNGVALTGLDVTVFPGSYEVATTSEAFTIEGASTFTVREPFDYPSLSDMEVTLSKSGLKQFRQLIKKDVSTCLKSKKRKAGCGLSVPATLSDGTKIVQGTVKRTLTADAKSNLKSLKPQESYTDPMRVTSEYIGGVNMQATCVKGGSRGTCRIIMGPSLGAPVVDFTSDPPTVNWDD
ncbi:MAG: hypothetical protein QM611_03765 [Microbacterium sp.]|uniref:hypothetical protein n=1 Tax=Microbacterium sp. TaxID=51671 RepID=UPI0039E2FA4E